MKKHMKKLIAMISAIAIVLTGMVIPKETVSAAQYGPFGYYIHKNVEGDTWVVRNEEDEQLAIKEKMFYVWEDDETFLQLQDLYLEMEDLNNLESLAFLNYQTAIISAGAEPLREDFTDTFDTARYEGDLAGYPEPQLSDFTPILDPESYEIGMEFWNSIKPLEEDYEDEIDVDAYNQAVVVHTEEVPLREDFTTDEEFNTEYAAWELRRPVNTDYILATAHELFEEDMLIWTLAEPTPEDFILKTAEEQYQESFDSWFVNKPNPIDYYIAGSGQSAYESLHAIWESSFETELTAYNQASASTLAKFEEFVDLLEYFRSNKILGEGPQAATPPTIPVKLTEVEKTIIERKGSEEILVSQSLSDGTKAAPINVINSIQGYRCQEIFDAKAKESEPGTKVVRTYSFHAKGSTDQKPIYHTENKVVISMTIPTAVREEGATYSFVCVSENGESFVFTDEDSNPNTITITTDRFYAYALCVTPAAND